MKYGVGIDISKGKSTVAILSVEGEIIEEPFEIMHDINGLTLLEEKMNKLPKEDLKIVMEETGTYHLPVLGYLLDKNYFVTAENALKIKKYLDRGLRKAKTDKKDSYKLAEYACDNWFKLNTDGWNVLAKQDGSLIDLSTNKNLYSLYYESKNKINFKVEEEGFIVKGEEVSTFLEEKLAILGLTEREKEEFIIYWLPKLENNKYNYIRFATLDEINANMPLEINPKPDTIIRILMTFKGLDNPIYVKEQELKTPERNGFVAVEWGGTEIK